MRNGSVRLFLSVAAGAALFFSTAFSAAAISVEYTEITKPGWLAARTSDINESGQVVGDFTDGLVNGGYIFDGSSAVELLPSGWDWAGAGGINDSGEVAGHGFDGVSEECFFYSGGAYTAIMPPGWTVCRATGINNAGQIVGGGQGGAGQASFLYSGGVYTTLLPPGWTSVWALDLNESGHVVGYGDDALGTAGFLFDGAAYTTIAPPGWAYAIATGINNNGRIVGFGSVDIPIANARAEGAGGERALAEGRTGFLYENGTYTTIIPPGWLSSMAQAINDAGHIVGIGTKGDGTDMGFLYVGGKYHEVPSPASTAALDLTALNDQGQLVGTERPGIARLKAPNLLSTFKSFRIDVNPIVDLKGNGGDGPVGILAGDGLKVTAAVGAAANGGDRCDWWLFVMTPTGIESFDPWTRSWRPGFFPMGGFPLRDVGPVTVLATRSLAPGPYTFYLGVDTRVNGRIDLKKLFYDVLMVVVY